MALKQEKQSNQSNQYSPSVENGLVYIESPTMKDKSQTVEMKAYQEMGESIIDTRILEDDRWADFLWAYNFGNDIGFVKGYKTRKQIKD